MAQITRIIATSKLAFIFVLASLTLVLPIALSRATSTTYPAGSRPTSTFDVAVVDTSGKNPFRLVSFEEGMQATCCLVLPKSTDTVQVGEFERHTYKVLASNGSDQLVEIERSNDDYTYWFRYRVSRDGLTAVSSQVIGPGHGIAGFAIALIVSLLLRAVARLVDSHRSAATPTSAKRS